MAVTGIQGLLPRAFSSVVAEIFERRTVFASEQGRRYWERNQHRHLVSREIPQLKQNRVGIKLPAHKFWP